MKRTSAPRRPLLPAVLLACLVPLAAPSQNSAPSLTSLSPSAVPPGASVTVTLNGTGLVSGSNVLLGGQQGYEISNSLCFSSNCPITYLSDTQMTVLIPASALLSSGTLSVQVQNPSGLLSNALNLTISASSSSPNPVPSIASLSPSTIVAGSAAFTLQVNGAGFVPGAVVQWNGSSLSTVYVTSTQLLASVPAADIAAAGAVSVTAVNPSPGGGASAAAAFTIQNGTPQNPANTGAPSLIWVLPVNTTAGTPGATLSLYGANYTSASTVHWNGAPRPTTYINSNELQVTLSASDLASPGAGILEVTNPTTSVTSVQWTYPIISPGVSTFAAGPQPVALAPVAVAADASIGRIYVVHRGILGDVGLNAGQWPSDAVTVVDFNSGNVLTTIGIGSSVNGLGQGIAVDTGNHHIFVTNADDNSVSILDGQTNLTLATTPVDPGPEGIATDPSLGLVFVAAANVALLDASSGAHLASIPVGGNALAVSVDSSTHRAYVLVNSVPQSIAVIDGTTRSLISQTRLPPLIYTYSAIAVDPGARAYVCDYNSGIVTPLDITGARPSVLSNFPATAPSAMALAVDPSTHFLYAVSASGAAVNVFDQTGAQQAAIRVRHAPAAIALDGAGHAYVADSQSDSLSVIGTAGLALTGTIALGVQNMGLALDTAANRLYAANVIAGAVGVLDPSARAFLRSWTSGALTWATAVDSSLDQVYAVNASDGSLSVFDTTTGALKTKIAVGATGAATIAVNPQTHRVYISAGSLAVVDGASLQPVPTIPVGDTPVGVALDPSTNRIYVANQHSGSISVIDGGSNQVTATWNQMGNVWHLAIDPQLGNLYASVPPPTIGSFSGLEVINLATGVITAKVSGGPAADDVAVNPATHHVFLGDSDDGTVRIIDGQSNAVLNTLVTGSSVSGLTVDPSSGLVYASEPYDASIAVFSDPAGGPPPNVNSGGLVNGASFSGADLTAGGVAAIFGANLAPSVALASSVPLPTTLAGVSVEINGLPAPLLFVSPGQIDFQIPWQFASDSQVTVTVVLNGASSAPQTFPLVPAGPAIFSVNSQGTGQGAVQIANTSILAAPPGSIPGATTQPASRGGYITIYCTGLGAVSNPPASGAIASANPLSLTLATPTVTIGGVPAPVTFSGLAPGFVALYQVNAQVPQSAPTGDAVPLAISVNGVSSNTVTIAVQ